MRWGLGRGEVCHEFCGQRPERWGRRQEQAEPWRAVTVNTHVVSLTPPSRASSPQTHTGHRTPTFPVSWALPAWLAWLVRFCACDQLGGESGLIVGSLGWLDSWDICRPSFKAELYVQRLPWRRHCAQSHIWERHFLFSSSNTQIQSCLLAICNEHGNRSLWISKKKGICSVGKVGKL